MKGIKYCTGKMIAIMLAGALAAGSLSMSAFGAGNTGDVVDLSEVDIEEMAEEATSTSESASEVVPEIIYEEVSGEVSDDSSEAEVAESANEADMADALESNAEETTENEDAAEDDGQQNETNSQEEYSNVNNTEQAYENPEVIEEENSFEEITSEQAVGAVSLANYYELEDQMESSQIVREIRQQMVERKTQIITHVKLSSRLGNDYYSLGYKLFTLAQQWRGDAPDEGDYLKHVSFLNTWSKTEDYPSGYSSSFHYYTLTYSISYYTSMDQEEEVENAANSIFEDLKIEGKDINKMSDYDAAKALYTYLVNTVDYDYDLAKSGTRGSETRHTAYGALVDHICLDDGFAHSLYYLLKKAGINTLMYTGTVTDNRSYSGKVIPFFDNGTHYWNIAQIEGNYYILDPTFDSCDKESGELHYFLIGSNNELMKNRSQVIWWNPSTIDGWEDEYSFDYSINENDFVASQQFQVYFDLAGGILPENIDYKVTNGDLYGITLTYEPERPGYIFLGWFTAPDGGNQITANTVVDLTEDQILYAHWKEGTYHVTLDPNGGNVTPASKTYTGYTTYGNLPLPVKNGYDFAGWYHGKDGPKKSDSIISFSNHSLIAHWEHTIEFDANGGTVTPDSKKITDEGKYGELPIPVKSGFTFDGWFKSINGEEQVMDYDDIDLSVSKEKLYAHWSNKLLNVQRWAFSNSSAYFGSSFYISDSDKIKPELFIAVSHKQCFSA